jgi:hypothetical protein
MGLPKTTIDQKIGVRLSGAFSAEDISDAFTANNKLVEKYGTNTDLNDVAPEDRDDYVKMLSQGAGGKKVAPYQMAASVVRGRSDDGAKKRGRAEAGKDNSLLNRLATLLFGKKEAKKSTSPKKIKSKIGAEANKVLYEMYGKGKYHFVPSDKDPSVSYIADHMSEGIKAYRDFVGHVGNVMGIGGDELDQAFGDLAVVFDSAGDLVPEGAVASFNKELNRIAIGQKQAQLLLMGAEPDSAAMSTLVHETIHFLQGIREKQGKRSSSNLVLNEITAELLAESMAPNPGTSYGATIGTIIHNISKKENFSPAVAVELLMRAGLRGDDGAFEHIEKYLPGNEQNPQYHDDAIDNAFVNGEKMYGDMSIPTEDPRELAEKVEKYAALVLKEMGMRGLSKNYNDMPIPKRAAKVQIQGGNAREVYRTDSGADGSTEKGSGFKSTWEDREKARNEIYASRINNLPSKYDTYDFNDPVVADMHKDPKAFWAEPEPDRRSNRFQREEIYEQIAKGKLPEFFDPDILDKSEIKGLEGVIYDSYSDLQRVRQRIEDGVYSIDDTTPEMYQMRPNDVEAFEALKRIRQGQHKRTRKQEEKTFLYKVKRAILNLFGLLTQHQQDDLVAKQKKRRMEARRLEREMGAAKFEFPEDIAAQKAAEKKMVSVAADMIAKYGDEIRYMIDHTRVSYEDIDAVLTLFDHTDSQLREAEKMQREAAAVLGRDVSKALGKLQGQRLGIEKARLELLNQKTQAELRELRGADLDVRAELGLPPGDESARAKKSSRAKKATKSVKQPKTQKKAEPVWDNDLLDLLGDDKEEDEPKMKRPVKVSE